MDNLKNTLEALLEPSSRKYVKRFATPMLENIAVSYTEYETKGYINESSLRTFVESFQIEFLNNKRDSFSLWTEVLMKEVFRELYLRLKGDS